MRVQFLSNAFLGYCAEVLSVCRIISCIFLTLPNGKRDIRNKAEGVKD